MLDVRWLALVLGIVSCTAPTASRPAVAPPQSEPVPAARQAPARRAESTVSIQGIEGSMSNYDVRTTMERRGDELLACQEPRVRVVPFMTGTVEFAIHVDRNGKVGEVVVRASDLGDRVLERCISDVILQTPFPPPKGGDAKITWTMILEPARDGMEPELWEQKHIQNVIDEHLTELRTECELPSNSKRFAVTAWVNRRGRVVASSLMVKGKAPPEGLDCIVEKLARWRMPQPTQSRFAKVSFKLASVGKPRASAGKPREAERRNGRAKRTVKSRPPRRR